MTRRGVGVVIPRQDELTGGAGGVLVAEPNHLRVALPTTAWQVVHGPQYRQPPQGFANGQLWSSPRSVHMGGVWPGLWSLEHILISNLQLSAMRTTVSAGDPRTSRAKLSSVPRCSRQRDNGSYEAPNWNVCGLPVAGKAIGLPGGAEAIERGHPGCDQASVRLEPIRQQHVTARRGDGRVTHHPSSPVPQGISPVRRNGLSLSRRL
jgi:hypothetical protein